MTQIFNPLVKKGFDQTGEGATFDGILGLTPLSMTDQSTGTIYELKVIEGILVLAESQNITTGILLQTGEFMLSENGGYLLQE